MEFLTVEHENQQHELTLPALLRGSEYKTDDPDRCRKDNLFGLAIAVVVHAHEGEVPKPQRQAWFDLWEDNRKKADQYWKKVAKFNYRHDPGSYEFQAPDTDSERTFEFLVIRPWLMKALFTTPDWGRLYSIIASQLTPSKRHHSEWWVKLRDICRRAQTSIEPFDAIAEIQKISEEYRTEQETDTTPAEEQGEKAKEIPSINIQDSNVILGDVQAKNLQIGDDARIDKHPVTEKPTETGQKEIVEVKPGVFGINIDIKELVRRFWKWVCSRSKD
ncbi:hypothetical protein ES703_51824 [subsurface metagenome]